MNKTKLCVECLYFEDSCEVATSCLQTACEKFEELCRLGCDRCRYAITEFRSNSDEEYVIGCKLNDMEDVN